MSEQDFQTKVLSELERMNRSHVSLYGNPETGDKGRLYYLESDVEKIKSRVSAIEKLKQFGSGAFWFFSLVVSFVALVLVSCGQMILHWIKK